MKKITLISFVLFSIVFVSCKENATSKIKEANLETAKERDSKINLGSAIIDFDKVVHEFGTINEGDVIEGSFKIYNKGKVDLIITNASASCGCTVPVWPKEPIKPGESADLTFTFDSKGKPGKQNKSITLQTNTEKITEVLRISGMVNKKI